MTEADRIIALFDFSGMEYKEIADKLGIKPQKISEWKSGKTKSYKKYESQIASMFNVSVDWLLTGENPDGTGGMMVSIDKDALMDAISKVKSNVVGDIFIDSEQYKKQKAFEKMLAEPADTHIIEVPDELSNLPVPAIIAIGSDENASAKIKEICEKYNNLSDENKSLAEHLLDELENNPDSGELISGILQLMKKQKPSTNGR